MKSNHEIVHASNSMEEKVQALLAKSLTDFSLWTSLIMEIEETSTDDIGIISRVYGSFLSEFPLCYGYWKKYANHMARLSSIDKVIDIYEEAVKAATYSVDVWADYCSFGMQFYEDLYDVRRLFERALAFVGKDYLCNTLWDKYIAFELTHRQWNHLIHIYIRSLRFPTKNLHSYYQSFKKLVALWEEEMKCQNITMEPPEARVESELAELSACRDSEIASLVSNLLDQSTGLLRHETLRKVLTIGEYFYQKSTDMNEKISYFEAQIRRPYFHMKPLDDSQLQIWHRYLDFVEMQGDFDWTVKLYERCLIPCANYPEYWVRYIEFMETKGGREIANLALARSSKSFLKRIRQFHYYCAKVKEQIGDSHGARSTLLTHDLDLSLNFVDHVNQQANMEKRLGNIGAAYLIYEKAIEMVREKQDIQIFSVLYMHFARFTYVVTGDLGATKEVFVSGISKAPHCKSLFEELIKFMAMHGGAGQLRIVDSIVHQAIVPEPGVTLALSPGDREDVSSLFLEFVDLCGTIFEIRKAWARHLKLFPHAMRHCTSFSCNINDIDVLEKTKEVSAIHDNDHREDGIGDSDKLLLLDDAQSSKKNIDVLLDGPAIAAKSHSEVASNSTNGNMQQAHVHEDARKLSEQQANGLPVDTDEALHEVQMYSPNPQGPSGCHEAAHKTQPLPDCESHDDLRPSLENLSIRHQDDESQQSKPANPHEDNVTQSPTNQTNHNHDEVKVEAPRQSNNDMHSIVPAITQTSADNSCESTPTEKILQQAEVRNLVQSQQPAQAPTNALYHQKSANWHQIHYDGSSQHESGLHGYVQTQNQRWQLPVQPQHPQSYSQVLSAQAYACQPQHWQANIPVTNQLQGQYHVATSPVYPAATVAWQTPNIQQNVVAGGQSQLLTQTTMQTHIYQHPLQSNDQHGYFQGDHDVSHQFWQYYHQQLCIQQQQQNSIHLQHPQQQQKQNFPHQQHQLQQSILQQQQLQNQLQMNHLLQQQQQQHVKQQQFHQPQYSQLPHDSQPCQLNKLQECSRWQDLSKLQQQDQQQQSQQEHLPQNLQQQQNQVLPKNHEQQQHFLLQQQQQQPKQQTDILLDVQTSNNNFYVQVQGTQISEQSEPVHPTSEQQSAPDQ